MMKRLLLTPFPLLIASNQGFADDGIKWGEPVNGLRLGIVNPPPSVTSDQRVTFKIEAQNVSQRSIALPTPETFVLKSNPQSNDYHKSPLVPVVEKTRPAPQSDQRSPTGV